MKHKHSGFTIVELLIVIVVIAILSAIIIVAYNGAQTRARDSKIQSDISQLQKAILAARIQESKPLYNITNNGYTANYCNSSPAGTDLADRSIGGVNTCWNHYENFLNTVSNASNMNIRGIKDPWGRPYRIDENENENNDGRCTRDFVGVYRYPHVNNAFQNAYSITIPNSLPTC